jgi:hypothetical protein
METKNNYEKIVADIHDGKYKPGVLHHAAPNALDLLNRFASQNGSDAPSPSSDGNDTTPRGTRSTKNPINR